MALVGRVLRHRLSHPVFGDIWLAARIIETEAYYRDEKGSHSSLGFTEKRRAMFMKPGTIYMYYARGGDSLNFSARGDGNGVLVKSGVTHIDRYCRAEHLEIMQMLNPVNGRRRPMDKLCSGQTLLCRSLGLKVPQWNQKSLQRGKLVLATPSTLPDKLVQAARIGIPRGRDEHLPYRFVDFQEAHRATQNPLKQPHRVIVRQTSEFVPPIYPTH